jgi:hypothetical protein
LKMDGFLPWLDEEDLIPGQRWQDEIPAAVRASDVVVVCVSHSSVNKEGYVQKEIKFVLDVSEEKPEGTIFVIPIRIEEVEVPRSLSQWQWVNWLDKNGYKRLLLALHTRAKALGLTVPPLTPQLPTTPSASPIEKKSLTAFTPKEIRSLGSDVSPPTRKSFAAALLEVETTWDYWSEGYALLKPPVKNSLPGNYAVDSPSWMGHLVAMVRTAGIEVPFDLRDWDTGNIEKNKLLLSAIYDVAVREKWSLGGGLTKLAKLIPEADALIARELIELPEREMYNHGLWQLGLQLGAIVKKIEDTNLAARAFATVIRSKEQPGGRDSLVEGVIGFARQILDAEEFQKWFRLSMGRTYAAYIKALEADRLNWPK